LAAHHEFVHGGSADLELPGGLGDGVDEIHALRFHFGFPIPMRAMVLERFSLVLGVLFVVGVSSGVPTEMDTRGGFLPAR
jgi:hypothetical protein